VEIDLRRDLGSAADAFHRGLGIAPEETRARHQLALVLAARGDTNAAVSELERILLIDPSHTDALTDRAVHDLAAGRPRDALEKADRALQAEPGYPRAAYYRAVALERAGRADESRSALRELAEHGEGKYSEMARRHVDPRANDHRPGPGLGEGADRE
jgi:Flp pilus assembly protein TadD